MSHSRTRAPHLAGPVWSFRLERCIGTNESITWLWQPLEPQETLTWSAHMRCTSQSAPGGAGAGAAAGGGNTSWLTRWVAAQRRLRASEMSTTHDRNTSSYGTCPVNVSKLTVDTARTLLLCKALARDKRMFAASGGRAAHA